MCSYRDARSCRRIRLQERAGNLSRQNRGDIPKNIAQVHREMIQRWLESQA